MFKKENKIILITAFLCLMMGTVSAKAAQGISKTEFKGTVGMSKQDVKNKFGPPDKSMDRPRPLGMMWVYFGLYDPETEKSDHYNNCSLFFDPDNDTVDHVAC